MAGFKLNVFSGIYPRLPESLLPDRAASVAQNCDFAYGELRNTKAGFQVGSSMVNEPASIYTDDGLTFYTWTSDVNAVRSPLVSDTYNRLYYTDGNEMKVTTRTSTQLTGGPPGTSFYVGVPRPTVKPTLAVQIPDVTDGSKYTLAWKFHWEYQGTKYQEQTITPTGLTSTTWRFTPPTQTRQVSYSSDSEFPNPGESGVVYKASDTGSLYLWSGSAYTSTSNDATPTQAFPVLRLTCTQVSDSAQFFEIYTSNSSFFKDTGLFSLSIANDAGASTYTVTLNTGIREADKDARAYVYTYVNTYGEEGPPSPPTIINTSSAVEVDVGATLDAVSGYAAIKEIRIYRTSSSSTIADYFYCTTITVLGQAAGVKTVRDNIKGEYLNEPLASLNWYAPPTGLVGLMSLPNGILCAWKNNELWFSEAYKPWAWPPTYVKPLPHSIVGGIAHGSGAIVTTVGQPHAVSGVSPDAMTTARLNVDQAGVSKWSIAVVDGAVMYASHDGLVTIMGNSASLAQGQKFFTREVWRTRYGSGLSGMRFSVWDGRLVVFHGNGSFTPFMIRFDEADGALTDLPNLSAKCAFISTLSDQFYYALSNNIYQFNGGNNQTATWESKEMVLQVPLNFAIAQSLSDGSWTIEFWSWGKTSPVNILAPDAGSWTKRHTEVVADGQRTFRLPSGFESDRWKVRIYGTGRFRELRVAQSGRELAKI